MDPTPFVIIGALLGSVSTLLIQAYGRRKVRQAEARLLAAQPIVEPTIVQDTAEIDRLAHRVAVLERIAVDRPVELANEIERLR